jgi:hypothetical protein
LIKVGKEGSGRKRALLCKPSHDEDSRKLKSCQSCYFKVGKKGSGTNKGIYANRTDIHEKQNIGLVRYSSRKREEKGKLQGNGQGTENGYT